MMSRSTLLTSALPVIGLAALVVTSLPSAEDTPEQSAQGILEATGVKGGLVVHLGCGDGKLTAALRANDSHLVHGLDRNARSVEAAREYIKSLGVYGPVSLDRLIGKQMPYTDNLVNLVVAEKLLDVPMEEIMRVLAPEGVAYVRKGDGWIRTVKERPPNIDEWTHYLHDASGNPVAHDTEIAPLRHKQWVGSPRYSRHHDHMSSVSAMVTSGGRLFYIFDEGSRASIELPSDWKLIARDAFNGTILWKRPIEEWHTRFWPLKSGPVQLTRRLVALGDRVYVTLGLEAPLTALDAATGETVRTYEGTEGTEEIILSEGVLFVVIDDEQQAAEPAYATVADARKEASDRAWARLGRTLAAIEADTGEILWRTRMPVAPLTLVADGTRVCLYDGEKVVCLDRRNGEPMWTSEPVPVWETIRTYFAPTLVLYDGVVLFAGGENFVPHRAGEDTMTAYSAETGQVLWTAPHPPSGYQSPEDVIVTAGLVWCGATTNGKDSGIFTGRDLHTGEVKAEFGPDVETHWFHHRCYRAKATDKYLLTSRTGIEFIDPSTQHWECHHWVRGACLYGIMPANGMIYTPPHPCACYLEAKEFGVNVLAAESESRMPPREVPDKGRLERGPAYGQAMEGAGAEDDWPTYRHDAERSGTTDAAVSSGLRPAWETGLGGKLSAPVAAEGKLFVASIEDHTVHALDTESGDVVWSYTTGARVDSPPTIHEGRVLFGCADGWVYCLRAQDGKLVWRFRAAPLDRRLCAWEQVESVWPVHGSVLVQDGTVYCVAGRSMFLDGGLRLLRLDPATGGKLSETILDDKDPESGENLQVYVKGLNMTVALPDILSSDGESIYLHSLPLDKEGNRRRLAYVDVTQQRGDDAHLFCATGFLDDTWWHRTYWVYGRSMASGAGGYYQAGHVAPAGRILVVDRERIYGFGRKPQYYKWTTPLEHHLFATTREIPEYVKPARSPGGSWVGVDNTESLNPAGKALTVTAWVKATDPGGVVAARGGDAHGYSLYIKGGKPQFAIRVSNEMKVVSSDEEVVGRWVHLAGVLTDDKQLQVYVDGKLSAAADAGAFIAADPSQPMEIGGDDGGPVGDYTSPFGLKGLIDEARVYLRALSAEEIADHAADGAPATDDALVLYIPFEADSAADKSGKGNDGELIGCQVVDGQRGPAARVRGVKRRGMSQLPFIVKHDWSKEVPLHARAMVLAGATLFIAGPPDVVDEEDAQKRLLDPEIQAKLAEQWEAQQGKKGALLWAVSPTDGERVAELELESPPVFDGMIAANGRLYLATIAGDVLCFAGG